MSTIAKILRECAYRLPDKEDSYFNVVDGEPIPQNSPFICDHLDIMKGSAFAKQFLHELGMGRGWREFLTDDEADSFPGFHYTREHQTMRAVFLLFAADLAEEWREP